MKLTKEHFDKSVTDLATKQQIEKLQRSIEKLDIRERVGRLEMDMLKIKIALYLRIRA